MDDACRRVFPLVLLYSIKWRISVATVCEKEMYTRTSRKHFGASWRYEVGDVDCDTAATGEGDRQRYAPLLMRKRGGEIL